MKERANLKAVFSRFADIEEEGERVISKTGFGKLAKQMERDFEFFQEVWISYKKFYLLSFSLCFLNTILSCRR